MGFLWRRRSSLVKIVVLLSAVWFTIAFLIYSEDRRTSGTAPSAPHNLPLIKNDLSGFDIGNNINSNDNDHNVNDENDNEIDNVILNSNSNDRAALPHSGHRKTYSNRHDSETKKIAGVRAAAPIASDDSGEYCWLIGIFFFIYYVHIKLLFLWLR